MTCVSSGWMWVCSQACLVIHSIADRQNIESLHQVKYSSSTELRVATVLVKWNCIFCGSVVVLGVCNTVVKRIQRASLKPWVCTESADHLEISSTDKSCWTLWLVHIVQTFHYCSFAFNNCSSFAALYSCTFSSWLFYSFKCCQSDHWLLSVFLFFGYWHQRPKMKGVTSLPTHIWSKVRSHRAGMSTRR